MRSRIDLRVRSSERDSSSPPTANRKNTVAPSPHSPRAAAPKTAIDISTFMSSIRALSETSARRHTSSPPKTIAMANAASTTSSGAPANASTAPIAENAPLPAAATSARLRSSQGRSATGSPAAASSSDCRP